VVYSAVSNCGHSHSLMEQHVMPHHRQAQLIYRALLSALAFIILSSLSLITFTSVRAGGSWSSTGSLATPRDFHTATLLGNGKGLVAGGFKGSARVSAELYDPTTNTWSAAASMVAGRYGHTATLLGNGKVLVAGGLGSGGYLTSAEVYNPTTNTWS